MELADLKAKKHQSSSRSQFMHQVATSQDQYVEPDELFWRTRLEPLRAFSLFEIRFCLNHAQQQRNGAGLVHHDIAKVVPVICTEPSRKAHTRTQQKPLTEITNGQHQGKDCSRNPDERFSDTGQRH
jgi:hypothetical protein